jgi:uncharacterized damage-inducible protein DinB
VSNAIDLYHYHVWANQKVLQHLRDLPEDIHRKELQSVFPTIGDTLAHIYIVDNVWLSAMSGETETIYSSLPGWQEEVKDATLSTFEACFAKVAARYEAFFARQTNLEVISEYPHPITTHLPKSKSCLHWPRFGLSLPLLTNQPLALLTRPSLIKHHAVHTSSRVFPMFVLRSQALDILFRWKTKHA